MIEKTFLQILHFGNDIWRVFFEKNIFLEHFYAGFL